MPEPKKSFEASRKELLETMTKRCGSEPVDRVICFGSEDVPKFLEKLDKFEAISRKSRLMVS